MKRLLLLASLALMNLAMIASAEEKPTGWEPSGNFSTTLQERYIGLRISRNIHEGWMIWNDLYINGPAGFYVDLWDSYSLENRRSRDGDEFDVTLGWHKELPKDIEFDISTTLFDLYPINKWWDGDVAVQTMSLARPFAFGNHVISPQARVEWISKTSDFGGGALILMPNVSHSWKKPFDIERLTLNHRAFVIWDDGFDGPGNDSDGIFFRWSAGLDWQLTKRFTWTMPGFTALAPLSRVDDGRRTETSWSTALTLRF